MYKLMIIFQVKEPPSWRFYRKIKPLTAFILCIVVLYGTVLGIRFFIERDIYLSRFLSWVIGEFLLSIFASCMALIMKNIQAGWYKRWWAKPGFHLLVFVTGLIVGINAHLDALFSKGIMSQFAARPSQLVHNI